MVRDERGKRRARDAGHDPGRREDREHPRPERVGIGAADHHIRDGWYRACAESLDGARGDEHGHRRREASDEKADREEREPRAERQRRTEPVGKLAGDDDPDEVREEERAEDPSVEGDPAEVVGDEWHDRRYRERFERDERHVENEAHGEPPPLVHQADIHLNGGLANTPGRHPNDRPADVTSAGRCGERH